MNFLISFSTLSLQSTLFSILTLTSSLNAQEIIFPGLRGDSLITELKKYYTPKKVLKYDEARTKLYTEIFIEQDSIECFYSGHKILITDKTKVLSLTAKLVIQIEHLWTKKVN